jgi:hypothetical protein
MPLWVLQADRTWRAGPPAARYPGPSAPQESLLPQRSTPSAGSESRISIPMIFGRMAPIRVTSSAISDLGIGNTAMRRKDSSSKSTNTMSFDTDWSLPASAVKSYVQASRSEYAVYLDAPYTSNAEIAAMSAACHANFSNSARRADSALLIDSPPLNVASPSSLSVCLRCKGARRPALVTRSFLSPWFGFVRLRNDIAKTLSKRPAMR